MGKVGQNTLNSLPPTIKAWLTYSGLMASRTAVLMKNEKSVRGRATQACHCQSQCVLCSQATWSSLRRTRERETDREAGREGGSEEGRGGSCGEKWSGAAIPRRPGNQRLFQRKKHSQWQTPAIVFRESHMTAKTPLPLYAQKPEVEKKQHRKRGKTETWGTCITEVFGKTHQQFTRLHEIRKRLSLPTMPSFLAAVVTRQVVRLCLQLTHLNTI